MKKYLTVLTELILRANIDHAKEALIGFAQALKYLIFVLKFFLFKVSTNHSSRFSYLSS